MAKSPKNSLKECVFVNSALKIPCHIVILAPTDCFFGDFAHWVNPLNGSVFSNIVFFLQSFL